MMMMMSVLSSQTCEDSTTGDPQCGNHLNQSNADPYLNNIASAEAATTYKHYLTTTKRHNRILPEINLHLFD
jgi:hypothetical protein